MTLDYFYGQAGELFSFYRIPKALFQEPRFQSLSTDAKTLYGILLDRMAEKSRYSSRPFRAQFVLPKPAQPEKAFSSMTQRVKWRKPINL